MQRLDRLAILLMVFSIIGFGCSFLIPKFKDGNKIKELSASFVEGQLTENEYIKNYIDITTVKYEVQNISAGLLTFAIFCFFFFKKNSVKTLNDFLSIRSIYKYSKYLLILNLGVFFIIGGMLESLITEDYQYPIYDNSTQAVFGLVFFLIFLLIFLNIIFHVFILQKRTQNTLLNISIKSSNNIFNGIGLLFVGILFIGILTLFIYYGSVIGVTASLIFIYITISLLSELNINDNAK